MINNIETISNLAEKYNIPFIEIALIDLNISGVNANVSFNRIRFTLYLQKDISILLSVENNRLSFYNIRDNKLFFKDDFLFNVDDLHDDTCKLFYTRKNGTILCFNPNNRNMCTGCRFCYQPISSEKQNISRVMLKDVFINWLKENKLGNLSHLEQVALITGCFEKEQILVDYLIELREILLSFDFTKEILYFGIISDIKNIERLIEIKPLQICFTIECFENRNIFLIKNKNLELNRLSELMKQSIEKGVHTTFSYIVGLDSIKVFKENMLFYKNNVNKFPIISLFQTDSERMKYRHKDAKNFEYYLECRKYIETIFDNTNLMPNSWNNYRSLWRTCYNGINIL